MMVISHSFGSFLLRHLERDEGHAAVPLPLNVLAPHAAMKACDESDDLVELWTLPLPAVHVAAHL